MELNILFELFPMAQDLVAKIPKFKRWLEKVAKREDLYGLLQLQFADNLSRIEKGFDRLEKGFDSLRTYILMTTIVGAMLSNPDLKSADVKNRFMESLEVAQDIVEIMEKASPK